MPRHNEYPIFRHNEALQLLYQLHAALRDTNGQSVRTASFPSVCRAARFTNTAAGRHTVLYGTQDTLKRLRLEIGHTSWSMNLPASSAEHLWPCRALSVSSQRLPETGEAIPISSEQPLKSVRIRPGCMTFVYLAFGFARAHKAPQSSYWAVWSTTKP